MAEGPRPKQVSGVMADSTRSDTSWVLYRFVGDPNTSNAYLWSNWTSRAGATTVTTPQSYYSEHVVARDGTAGFAVVLTTASASGTFDFYKNGADAGDIPFTTSASTSTGYDVVSIGVSVAAGDEIAVRSPTSVTFGCEVLIHVLQTGATVGVTLGCWSGQWPSTTANRYLLVSGDFSQGSVEASGAGTAVTMPSACTLGKLAYGTQSGDTTTEINIYVNGASDQSFTLPAAEQGLQTLTATSLAAGDEVEVLYEGTDTGGTAPGFSQIQIEATGFDKAGALYLFGNASAASSQYQNAWYARGSTLSAIGDYGPIVMALPGSCHYAGQSGGAAGLSLALYKNGAETERFGGTPGAAEFLSTTYAAGDEFAVRNIGTIVNVNVLIHMG